MASSVDSSQRVDSPLLRVTTELSPETGRRNKAVYML